MRTGVAALHTHTHTIPPHEGRYVRAVWYQQKKTASYTPAETPDNILLRLLELL